jgi:hypothetical protein
MPTMQDLSFAEWKMAAQRHANDLDIIAGDDLWDDGDSYDLREAASAAFAEKEDPKAFIERIFEEDLARREHDDQQAQEALEYEDEEDEP